MLERQFECVWKDMKTVRDLITCIPAQVRSLRALRSSTSWGKMKISALPSCVNSSTSLISSSWGCRKSKRMCRAKTRSHSETSDIKHSLSPGVFVFWSVIVSAGLWVSVRTTGLWSEPVWRNFSRTQVDGHVTHFTHEEWCVWSADHALFLFSVLTQDGSLASQYGDQVHAEVHMKSKLTDRVFLTLTRDQCGLFYCLIVR